MKATTPRAGWANKKLNELGFVGRGKSKHRPRNDPRLYGGQYPFVQTADIMGSEFYITRYSKTYSEIGLAQSKLWHKDTLCITIAGENTAESAILSFTACFPDSVVGFIADSEKSDVRFVKYYLDTIKRQIKSITRGATQDNLSLEKLLSFDILTPPLPTQRKIVAILSAYDDLIENNTRRIKILEAMAQLLYREWFIHFRFPGHEGVKMKNGVPEGWEITKLSKLVETQYGYTESATDKEVGPKFLRGMDINKTSYIQWDGVPYCPIAEDDHAKFKLGLGDILIIRMADPGKVGIVEKEIDAVFASYLIRLQIASPKLSPYYLFCFLLSDEYQGYVTGASTGTTRKSASAGVIVDVDIAIPPDEICQDFENKVSAIRRMLNNLLEKNANLRRTRDLLLPKLVSGEVEVKSLLDNKTNGIKGE